MTIKLLSLKALAEAEDTTHGYLKLLMLRVRKGELDSWRGYRFASIGSGHRSTWFAYNEDLDITVKN
ncbi:MAG: hypothetical protein KC475_09825 [Cyanobacteria bacterium HKST-UBA03]|nr:hypothetical protein [Cyanobacteria bacterium HKST-UBA03]